MDGVLLFVLDALLHPSGLRWCHPVTTHLVYCTYNNTQGGTVLILRVNSRYIYCSERGKCRNNNEQ